MTRASSANDPGAVRIVSSGALLEGSLVLPPAAQGVVLFAHGSGSSRYSPRNRFVAAAIQEAGFATLLFDLLTGAEEAMDAQTGHLRFDVRLLADRLLSATDWALAEPSLGGVPIGYFGASTGAAAALVAASERPTVGAIVSRGGRPDLAGDALAGVRAPTLLIVGGADTPVLAMNQAALAELRCPKQLAVVPHATHLFEEPGALEEVARLAADWFARHLSRPRAPAAIS